MAGSKRDATFSQKELARERQHKGALKSKVDAMEGELKSRTRELEELKENAMEKLSNAGSHMQQTRQEVASLKAKVQVAAIKQGS